MIPFPLQEPTQPELRGAWQTLQAVWTTECEAHAALARCRGSHATRKALQEDIAHAEDAMFEAIQEYIDVVQQYLRTTDHQSAA